MSERYSTTRIPYARALGAPPVMRGTYDGAELGRTCLRPGAYDAFALPSGGQQSTVDDVARTSTDHVSTAAVSGAPRIVQTTGSRDFLGPDVGDRRFTILEVAKAFDVPVELIAHEPPAPASPPTLPKRCEPYAPRSGSNAARLIEHLQHAGGHVTAGEAADLLNIAPGGVLTVMSRAIAGGFLQRVVVDGVSALALPGYRPSEPPPEEVAAAEALLQQRRHEAMRWTGYVHVLRARQAYIASLPSVPPLPAPPALTNAA